MFNRFLRQILPHKQRQAVAAPIHVRVSVIIHNPILVTTGFRQKTVLHVGEGRLTDYMRWNDPDQLIQEYRHHLRTCSGGIARYEVVERIVVDGYPVKADGFCYDEESYLRCWQQRSTCHAPDAVDYQQLVANFDMIRKVEQNQIDEVWLIAFPYAGYYESTMVGQGAFWCNSPPVPNTGHCTRRFVLMGFNYERDVGCMLESFGHRVESIMRHVYRHHSDERNVWQCFTRYDRIAPGQAECGTVHFAPNSEKDYDWGNPKPVMSRADTWYSFPDLQGSPRQMTCADWGNGDMCGHHRWWLEHLPRVEGETDGIYNNWWHYILRPDTVP